MYEAVDFLEKMAWYMAELDDILALNKNDRIVESELCESKLAEAIEVFDEEKCMNDEYDGEYEQQIIKHFLLLWACCHDFCSVMLHFFIYLSE